MYEKKIDIILIRCRPSTKKAWKMFVAKYNFKNYEEALLYLLRKEAPRIVGEIY